MSSLTRIRQALLEDRPDHLRLLRHFHDSLPRAERDLACRLLDRLWPWKYFSPWRTSGDRPTVFFLSSRGKTIATVSYLPLRTKIGSRILKAHWLTDLIVNPAFRGRGMGSRLIKGIMSRLEIKLIVGLWLTPIARKIYRRHSFGERPDIDFWGCDLARRTKPVGQPARSWRAVPVDRFSQETDRLYGRISRTYDSLIVRDQQYLNWRYCDIPIYPNPYRKYLICENGRLRGILVLRINKRDSKAGMIKELFIERNDIQALRFCLRHAKEMFHGSGIRVARLLVDECRNPWTAELRNADFFPLFRPPGLVFHIPRRSNVPKTSILEKNLHISAGDSDLGLLWD